MKIKRITNATYTGGGIYVFTGELENGTWFIFSSIDESITLVNEEPSDLDEEEGCLWWEWQEPRLVGYADEAEMRDVYRWLLDHPIDDNYLPSDIERLLEDF